MAPVPVTSKLPVPVLLSTMPLGPPDAVRLENVQPVPMLVLVTSIPVKPVTSIVFDVPPMFTVPPLANKPRPPVVVMSRLANVNVAIELPVPMSTPSVMPVELV